MRRQIVTGKLSCLQTMTELELRISFVQSMCLGLALWTFPLCINTVLSKAFHYLFIVCLYRYEEKRWVSRDGQAKSPPRGLEEKASIHWQRPGEKSGHGYTDNSENLSEERKHVQAPSTKDSVPAARISLPLPPRGPDQVF